MQTSPMPTARALVERAITLAQDTRVAPTTLHLMAVAIDGSPDLARLLRSFGLRSVELRQAIAHHQEPDGTLARAQSQSRQLAVAQGLPEPSGRHLLAAAVLVPDSVAGVVLRGLGQDLAKVARTLAGPVPVVRAGSLHSAELAAASASIAASQGAPRTPTSASAMVSRSRLSPHDARRVQPVTPPPLPRAASARPKPARAKPADAPDEVTAARRKSPLLDRWLVPTAGHEVIGREDELARLRDATERRDARGSLLVGAPGVGKGAVLTALARETGGAVLRLRHADVMAAMRGDEAEAARSVLAWAARGHAVVALDPLAAWTSPRETPDEVLAPMRSWMQSGRVAWVGVATPEEARRLAESDPWVERSAQRIDLDELPPAQVTEVVVARARTLSSLHGVGLDDELAKRAVALCDRFVGGRAQPERTLTVLDLGLARARREGRAALDDDTLCDVVAGVAGLPRERVASSDHARLLALEEHLAARVVGHRAALARMADVVRRNAVGFRGSRPLGTFLLLGPTGVGKTETAKALAEALFPGDGGMTRFDMAEFTEAHAVARLVGAPPGYVGYGEGGQLTEAVKRRPWQLILLDEVEKAHRDVLQALLGLLDEGRMTDGRGRTADFRNTLIVMTSNLGAEAFQSTMTRRGVGFASARSPGDVGVDASQAVLDAARASLPPELWNRIDEPLVFGALSRAEVAEVARRLLHDRAGRLEREQGVALTVDASVVDLLLDGGGYDVLLGARPMRRAVARLVEAPLAEAVLRGRLPRGAKATVRSVDGALRIEVAGDP